MTIEDVSVTGSRRKRVTVVIGDEATPATRDAILMQCIKSGRKQSHGNQIKHGPVDVVIVFGWADASGVDKTPAKYRALFVRTGSTRGIPAAMMESMKTTARHIAGGTVYISEV